MVQLPATLVMPGKTACEGEIADLSTTGTLFVPQRVADAGVGAHGVFCLAQPQASFETVVRIARIASYQSGLAPIEHALGLEFVSPSRVARASLDRLTRPN